MQVPSAARRPMLDRFQATPWASGIDLDGRRVGPLLDEQVHVAVVGDGPMSGRQLVPLTRAAAALLHGSDAGGAERVLRGLLAPLDGHEGAAHLRGISLSDSPAGFAANLMVSNVEAGYLPDHLATGNRAALEASFARLGAAARSARAQNTGWLDLGPKLSGQALAVARHGDGAGSLAAEELALVAVHEAQHAITPPPPATGVAPRLVWLEEGTAEALAWWPGATRPVLERMGVSGPGRASDPWVSDPSVQASTKYRQHHRAVLGLLDLAGVTSHTEAGAADPAAAGRARQLLQGRPVDQVPRSLARAIARHNGLPAEDVPALAELIVETAGDRTQVQALAAAVRERSPAPPAASRPGAAVPA